MKKFPSGVLASLCALTLSAALAACSSPDSSAPSAESPSATLDDESAATSTPPKFPAPGVTLPGLGKAPTLPVTIIDTLPFSSPSGAPFVQGVEFEEDGSLLIGTGLYGESKVYRLRDWINDPAAPPTEVHDLAPELFGEGITRHDDRLWQVTWKEGKAIERDAASLEQRREVPLETEGWGACSFQDTVVTSDGSGTLTFRNPKSFAPEHQVPVRAAGEDTTWLNELECVDTGRGREVWANVWQSPYIYRIDASSGEVTGIVDAELLLRDLAQRVTDEERSSLDVLNGIGLIPGSSTEADGSRDFLLTGKKWPYAYRVNVGDGVGKREKH